MFHCFNPEARSSDFFVSPKSLSKLLGSFWFSRCGIGNACDECGSSSSTVTMLVVELFDIQEESFGSPEMLPLSRFKSWYRFLYLYYSIASLEVIQKQNFLSKREAKHMSVYHQGL